MKVSINLVTWNGKKYLPYCLKSIAQQTFRDFSLLILDNGSTDGTVEYLKEIQEPKSKINLEFKIPNLRIVFNEKNTGFAAGHNRAIRATHSEYVLILNQDVILEPNFLEVVIKFLETHSEVGAVTGKLLRWNFENERDFYKQGIVRKTNFLDSVGLKIFKNHRVVELGAGEVDSKKWSMPCEVFGVSGAASVYRRKALEDVVIPQNRYEYFDEDFFSYKEDVDLAYRLRLRGWKTWFLPEARAYHDRAARSVTGGDIEIVQVRKRKSKFVNYHSYKNHLFFLIKSVPSDIWLRYGYRIVWYEFKKIIYLLFFEPQTLGAWGEFLKKLPTMLRKRTWVMKSNKVSHAVMKKWLS